MGRSIPLFFYNASFCAWLQRITCNSMSFFVLIYTTVFVLPHNWMILKRKAQKKKKKWQSLWTVCSVIISRVNPPQNSPVNWLQKAMWVNIYSIRGATGINKNLINHVIHIQCMTWSGTVWSLCHLLTVNLFTVNNPSCPMCLSLSISWITNRHRYIYNEE